MSPPFPEHFFLAAVRSSAKALRVKAGISITEENIKRLLQSPAFNETFERVSKDHGLTLPLNFSSYLDELNFISILSLLNFGSGYRVPLHTQTGRGAWDSIRAFTMGLYITSPTDGDLLSAQGLKDLNISKIAELMGINLHIERPHSRLSGVVVGELGGPLYRLAKGIETVLNETGSILVESGYQNLGSFVAEALNQATKVTDQTDDAMTELLLSRLVRAFPAFRDMTEVNGQPVYCFKKAMFLIHAIAIRFGRLENPPFPIPNTSNLPVFSDNVLPSMLVHLGVISIPTDSPLSALFPGAGSEESLSSLLGPPPAKPSTPVTKEPPQEGPVVTQDQSYILRAAAIDACELIVSVAQSLDPASPECQKSPWLSKLNLPDLDMWIWAGAKDRSDYRALKRFVDQNTIYF